MAGLAGGEWPSLARQAAVHLSGSVSENSQIGFFLLEIYFQFLLSNTDRMFSRELAVRLNNVTDPPWASLRNGREIDALWLSRILGPYGVRPKTIWIGDAHAKGYLKEDFMETFQRYISKSELEAFKADLTAPKPDPAAQPEPEPSTATAIR